MKVKCEIEISYLVCMVPEISKSLRFRIKRLGILHIDVTENMRWEMLI